jgi:F0F1-type ATP synthase membrane subunit b/b'
MRLLESIMSQLGVDHTFFFQFILVVVAYLFLSRLLFNPILASLLTRRYKVEGLKRAADSMLIEHDTLAKDYKAQWREYDIKAKASSNKIITEAKVVAKKDIDDSSLKASEYIKTKRQEITATTEKLSAELNNSSTQIEGLIKNKLLGVQK